MPESKRLADLKSAIVSAKSKIDRDHKPSHCLAENHGVLCMGRQLYLKG